MMSCSEIQMIGESPAMVRVKALIAKAAQSGFTVLVEGESGTGKELVARAIHAQSERSSQPLISVNCASLPRDLIESEMFGHEAGAFTGAHKSTPGRFERARTGTLFLDEIGEMDIVLQAKLLRAIEEGEIERLGGTKPIRLDIRFIAATNRDLTEAIADGRFREDLYFRLNVITIRTPPLRERPEDIPALARAFISQFGSRARRTVLGITCEAESMLCAYHWPGNIRELKNAVQHAIAMGSSDFIEPQDLPPQVLTRVHAVRNGHAGSSIDRVKAMLATGNNVAEIAQRLGVSESYIYRLRRNGNKSIVQ